MPGVPRAETCGGSPGRGLQWPGQRELDFPFLSAPIPSVSRFSNSYLKIICTFNHLRISASIGNLMSAGVSVVLLKPAAPSKRKPQITHYRSIWRRVEMGFKFRGCALPCFDYPLGSWISGNTIKK